MEPLSRITPAILDVLEVLLGPDEELYGLKIAQAAGLKTGTVYPILTRLEAAAWVESYWEQAQPSDRGPRRRFYRLNPDGITAARAALSARRGAAPYHSPRAAAAPRPALGHQR
ncbi:MAG TPA: helix-turn-helix transcriptional regulator [Dehalococcoidia bacterium]|nr:helix-turn-helix transcriptional regulator [Dehalococcoidia bacterium]